MPHSVACLLPCLLTACPPLPGPAPPHCALALPLLTLQPPLQEKRSSYAPTEETPVRYDGIYRIVKCWRTKGKQVSARWARHGGGLARHG